MLSSLAGLLLLTLLVATIHAFKLFPGEAPQWVERLWTFLSILFPGLAGAIGGVAAMREHRRTRDRFLQVKEGLNRIQERLRAPGTETTISIAKEAHSLLLGENLAWFDVLRYHELEPA